jgi:proteasome lid subunit RPN8/RPN11
MREDRMTPALLKLILAHASREAPRESCGLLVSTSGNLAEYVPCRNLSSLDHFQIHPEDWADCEDRGHVLGVAHSHPGQAQLEPSPWDLEGQAETGLPWYIVLPDSGAWLRFGASPQEGRVFAWGVEDCFSLVSDYYGGMVDFLREPKFWESTDLFRRGMALAGFHERGLNDPAPGDVMLFSIHGNGIPNHCAVYLGYGTILHHLPGRLSRVEPIGAWVRDLVAICRRNP